MKISLIQTHPEIAEQWHPTRNILSPKEITYGSNKKVWWLCKEEHEWETKVKCRTRGENCPICNHQRVHPTTCLLAVRPDIAKEWHKDNLLGPEDVMPHSEKIYKWQCLNNSSHSYFTSICNKTYKVFKCPECRPLSYTHPELVARWSLKNILKPNQVNAGSSQKAWWICKNDDRHEWECSIRWKVKNNGECPYCHGTEVHPTTCLLSINPEICKEWHPDNDFGPESITSCSGQKVKWLCLKDKRHSWTVSPASRINSENGCPLCSKRKINCTNCLSITNPEVLKYWDYKNNKVSPGEISSGDKKNYHWVCDNFHHYEGSVRSKVEGRPCPKCKITNEMILFNILSENNIKFEHNYYLSKLEPTLKRKFNVDFYLSGYNTIVELDGRQHFEPVRFNNQMSIEQAKQNFSIQAQRDKFVSEFCQINKINLIRIDGRIYKYNKLREYSQLLINKLKGEDEKEI